MTETEKDIFTLLLALTERICGLSEVQLATNRLLAALPIADEQLRLNLRAAVSRAESELDQTQSFLADAKALSKRL